MVRHRRVRPHKTGAPSHGGRLESPVALAVPAVARCAECGTRRHHPAARIYAACGSWYPSPQLTSCPHCRSWLWQSATSCPRCGTALHKGNEVTHVAVTAITGIALLYAIVSVSSSATRPSLPIGVMLLAMIALSYVADGVLLGLTIPHSRHIPKLLTVAIITSGNTYLWPNGTSSQLISATGESSHCGRMPSFTWVACTGTDSGTGSVSASFRALRGSTISMPQPSSLLQAR
jgi:hypothetical protein